MESSEFGLSENNAALLRKFQGNGWALTCTPGSHKELSGMLGDAVAAAKGDNRAPALVFPTIRYEPDWADTVLDRSMAWKAEDGEAPLWLTKATEAADCALFQLPAPDNRWIVKFAGKILEPFNYRLAGWSDLHEIMVHGFMLDRTALIDGHSSLAEMRRRGVNLLRSAELIRTETQEYGSQEQKTDDMHCSVTGAKLHGHDTQTREGKIEPDRWRTCADDFDRQLQKRLDRVLESIRRKDVVAATVLKKAIHCRNGVGPLATPLGG